MVQVLGNATTGTVYNDDTTKVDLPRDTATTRPAHRRWCADCKRTGRDLNEDDRCEQCARAVITRAEGAARRAAAELAAAEAKKATTTTKKVKKSTPTTTPKKEPTSVRPPSPEVENRDPAPRPTAAQNLDAQVEHAARLLRATADHPHPGVRAARTVVVAALEALHLLNELTPATTNVPAARPAPARSGPPRIELPADDVIDAYAAGQTLDQIAATHGCSAPTIARLLDEHGIARRGSPVPRSPELTQQVRDLYLDQHLSQVEVGRRLGVSTKVVQSIMTDAGIEARAPQARTARDNAIGLKQQIADLGVAAADIKRWAIAAGHLTQMQRGLPARALVEKYAAAHRDAVA